MFIFIGIFILGIILIGYAGFIADKPISFMKKRDITNILLSSIIGTSFMISGFGLACLSIEMTPQEICEEYSICYELVETVAENTKYSEADVAKFFIIVSDDVEAWDAIKMLDSSLTDEQVNAIMEIRAMKQAE